MSNPSLSSADCPKCGGIMLTELVDVDYFGRTTQAYCVSCGRRGEMKTLLVKSRMAQPDTTEHAGPGPRLRAEVVR